MRVCRVEIEGLRGVKEGVVDLGQHTVLVGPNNCGKSTILEALMLALQPSTRSLSEYLFFGGRPTPAARVRVQVTLTGFPTNDPSDYPEWFNTSTGGALPLYWNEERGTLSPDDEEDGSLAVTIAWAARYDHETGEIETKRYFVDGEGDPFLHEVVEVPPRLLRNLSVLYVSPEHTLSPFARRSGPLSRYLRQVDALPVSVLSGLREALFQLKPAPEDDEAFSKAVDTIMQWLWQLNLLPRDHRLIYRVTDLEADSILASLSPLIESPDVLLPLFQTGKGTSALLGVLLPLLPAISAQAGNQAFIILIDEPELHLHPGFHGVVADFVRGLPHQSILVTHSPHTARSIPAEDIVVIRRTPEGTLHSEPLVPRNNTASARAVRTLYHKHRTELLSAILGQAVVVPEGETDSLWLSRVASIARLYRSANPPPPNSAPILAAVGTFPTPNAQVARVCQDLLRVGSRILPVVDGDKSGVAKCHELEKVGVNRAVQWPPGWGIESVIAWICQPVLTCDDGKNLVSALCSRPIKSVEDLRDALIGSKKDWTLISSFLFDLTNAPSELSVGVWRRAYELWHDLAALALRETPEGNLLLQWNTEQVDTLTLLRPVIGYEPEAHRRTSW